MQGKNRFQVTVVPTGTGSYCFSTLGSPYIAVQLYRTGSSATTSFVSASYSNFSVDDVPGASVDHPGASGQSPLSASGYGSYWRDDPTFSGSLFTASAPASQMWLLGNVGALHGRIDFGSATGGTFIFSVNRKGGGY